MNTFICNCGKDEYYENIQIHLEECIYPNLNIDTNDILIFLIERIENDSDIDDDLVDDYTINKSEKLWMIISIYGNSSLDLFIDIIKDNWFKCCFQNKHTYIFNFNNCEFSNTEDRKFNGIFNGSFTSNTKMSSIFTDNGINCTLEYDSILSTYLKITLIKKIKTNIIKKKKKININNLNDLNNKKN